jgi:hypothetical protein
MLLGVTRERVRALGWDRNVAYGPGFDRGYKSDF